jgi:hypothetical protein
VGGNVKKGIILALAVALIMMVACGGESDQGGATGKAQVAQSLFDNLMQKGDLKAAYDMLAAGDRAMMGMIPGFYDFLTGKDSEAVPEEMKIFRVVLEEITPIPDNVISYSFGEPEGEGDTLMVPFTISYPVEDMEDFVKEQLGEELSEKMDNMDDSDMSYEEKVALIKEAMGKLRSAVKGKTFERETVEDQLMLVKEDGKWKVSILASALMNSFGGM